jgi:YD repeat-containing protein
MKKIILVFTFLFIAYILYGQKQEVSSVIAPSPNASMLAKFANIPVNHYSGLPQITVPLYVLKGRDLQLDINLSYHAQGVKVDQYAGPTGMNWALNSGGVITRVVKGMPDEVGYSGKNHEHGKELLDDIYNLDEFSKYKDGEPDIFYYNFFGRSGKFFIDAHGDCYTMPYQKLKITPAIGVKGIGHWEIIDENGYKYIFGQGSSTETTKTKLFLKPSSAENEKQDIFQVNEFISAWYINKAKSPLSTDSIMFTYFKGSSITTNLKSQKSFYVEKAECLEGGNGKKNFITDYRFETTIIDPVYISKIENQLGKVRFFYDYDRKDLPGALKVEFLTVNDYNNELIERYWFDYYYYFGQFNGQAINIPCSHQSCQRLFLKAIYRGKNKGIKYREFNYLENFGNKRLPPYNSFMVDHWGFNNYPEGGIDLSYGNIYTKLPGNGDGYYSAIKYTSTTGMIGTLNKIVYATGGYTKFKYIFVPGGNKVKEVIDYNSENEIVNSTSYSYTLTGGEIPKYVTNFSGIEFQTIPLGFGISIGWGCETNESITSSESLNTLYDLDGIYLGASKVIETLNDGSTIEYYYTNYNNQPDELPNNYRIILGKKTSIDPLGQPFTSHTYKGWERGLLDKKIIKNAISGEEKLIEDYKYKFDADNITKIKGIKSMNIGYVAGPVGKIPVFNVGEYYLISKPFYLDEIVTTEKENDDKTTNIKYDYNPKNLLIEKETINNGNELLIKKYKYAVDYASNVDSDLSTLINKNILSAVVENQIWKADLDNSNSKIIGGTVTNYDLFGKFVLPSISYSLKINDPLSESLFGENLNDQGPFKKLKPNNNYTQDAAYQYDDLSGNLVQVIGNDEVPVTYLYGYKKFYPVSKITGALHDDVLEYIPGYTGVGNLSSSQISSLRNNLPNAHISTFTYDPLKGMTSETGPDNIKLTYEYDDFGRLKLVKDHNGDILKRYTYQYKVQ